MTPSSADAPPSAKPRDEGEGSPSGSLRSLLFKIVGGVFFAAVVLVAMWPVRFDSREELFEIPKGTFARHMAGDTHDTLPPNIYLVLGIHNVLTLKNSDDVPHFFGPTLLAPGQTLRIPFTRASENSFSCTAHASGQLIIVVEENPTWPWERLIWRARRLLRSTLATS